MTPVQPAKLLRLLFSERDRHEGHALYEAVVQKCRELSIAGASVFRGLEGFGESAGIHRSGLLTHDLPIVVSIVDTAENVARLIPALDPMLDKALIVVSDVEMRRIRK